MWFFDPFESRQLAQRLVDEALINGPWLVVATEVPETAFSPPLPGFPAWISQGINAGWVDSYAIEGRPWVPFTAKVDDLLSKRAIYWSDEMFITNEVWAQDGE